MGVVSFACINNAEDLQCDTLQRHLRYNRIKTAGKHDANILAANIAQRMNMHILDVSPPKSFGMLQASCANANPSLDAVRSTVFKLFGTTMHGAHFQHSLSHCCALIRNSKLTSHPSPNVASVPQIVQLLLTPNLSRIMVASPDAKTHV